jgi:hypothetical protein
MGARSVYGFIASDSSASATTCSLAPSSGSEIFNPALPSCCSDLIICASGRSGYPIGRSESLFSDQVPSLSHGRIARRTGGRTAAVNCIMLLINSMSSKPMSLRLVARDVLNDLDGDWHAEPGHPVENVPRGLRVGTLSSQTPSLQTPADDGRVSTHSGFNQASPAVARTALPGDASMLPNCRVMSVTLRCRGLARNRCRTGHNDD